jgi:predicted RNase H-like HicB family nuclease
MGGLSRVFKTQVQLYPEERLMQTIKYVLHWQEDDAWLGYLEEYPDYWTQGDTLAVLVKHLKDLYLDLSGGHIPGARKVGELGMP